MLILRTHTESKDFSATAGTVNEGEREIAMTFYNYIFNYTILNIK
jgi:hypothetical protein